MSFQKYLFFVFVPTLFTIKWCENRNEKLKKYYFFGGYLGEEKFSEDN
jgi:hypothetical protein